MKYLISICISLLFSQYTYALMITEVMSNPTGDDNGREWIEIYNDTASDIDLNQISVSVKSGTPVPITHVSGGTVLAPHTYAVIASTVSGGTRFLQDYPSYTGSLFRASISLVNTGVTSLDVRLSSVVADAISSYTAAKEGYSYSKIGGTFSVVTPSPGVVNESTTSEVAETSTTSTVGTQTSLPQSSPSADIVIYLPDSRTVVAGAPTLFQAKALTSLGKVIDNVAYTWSFGDGGQSQGASTTYRYFYPGRYVAFVDVTNGLVAGKGRMLVRVVSPDVTISSLQQDKHGMFLEITNPNSYELDMSYWKISINGAVFTLPNNTVFMSGVTKIPVQVLGFTSTTTVVLSHKVKLLFPNGEVVTERSSEPPTQALTATSSSVVTTNQQKEPSKQQSVSTKKKEVIQRAGGTTTKTLISTSSKDKRIATFLKSLFK